MNKENQSKQSKQSKQYIKLNEHNRIVIYQMYLTRGKTQVQLAQLYGVSRQTISVIIKRARQGDFSIHKPVNIRWNTQEYIDKRESKRLRSEELKAKRKIQRDLIKASRYEHELPNSMLHMDLKLLPPILGESITPGQKQYLLAVVDDCSRKSWFEIIDGKNQHQVTSGLRRIFSRMNMTNICSILSDNGKEFKGLKHQHAVEKLLIEMGIKHYYTRVRRPQTNGKVERINRTISEEFLTKVHFNSRLERELQLRYYEYHYNNHRTHQGINNQTPNQKYQQLSLIKF
jgi:transposase InsO family protein